MDFNQLSEQERINLCLKLSEQERINLCLGIIRSFVLLSLKKLTEAIEEEYDIKGGISAPSPTQKVEEEATGSANVSFKVVEAGKSVKESIKIYGLVKDIINADGKQQINVIYAKKLVDEKKPILENILETEANKYKKQLEDLGAKVEIIK